MASKKSAVVVIKFPKSAVVGQKSDLVLDKVPNKGGIATSVRLAPSADTGMVSYLRTAKGADAGKVSDTLGSLTMGAIYFDASKVKIEIE